VIKNNLKFLSNFCHKKPLKRDIVYMIAFLDLLDTEEEKYKFTDLYNLYKDLLYWIALKKVGNIEDAEECVQETFFYIAKHFDKIGKIDSKSTKCYLSTIVAGFAIDKYNNYNKYDTISNDDIQDNSNDFDELKYFENFDKIELLSVFDKALDDESKVYFYLKYIYGYKSNEIANLYNVKDSYIRKKLQYAKEKLRKYLEEGTR
jgi:RNA polymerase sigma-70 factor (ECF subfamily)